MQGSASSLQPQAKATKLPKVSDLTVTSNLTQGHVTLACEPPGISP